MSSGTLPSIRFGDPISRLDSDPERALQGAPHDALRILLAHQPRSITAARTLGLALALGGHTHGGQFFPYNHLTGAVFPYPSGHFRDGTMHVVIGRGLGTFGPAIRSSAPELSYLQVLP